MFRITRPSHGHNSMLLKCIRFQKRRPNHSSIVCSPGQRQKSTSHTPTPKPDITDSGNTTRARVHLVPPVMAGYLLLLLILFAFETRIQKCISQKHVPHETNRCNVHRCESTTNTTVNDHSCMAGGCQCMRLLAKMLCVAAHTAYIELEYPVNKLDWMG